MAAHAWATSLRVPWGDLKSMARSTGPKASARLSNEALTKAEATALPDVLQFMRLLWAIVHALQMRSKEMSKMFGVTGPQRLVLRVVGLFPGISPGALAEILHLHPSTVTGVLQRLVRQGLLRRSAHPNDRRRSVLVLTPKGVRVNTRREGTVERAVQDTLEAVAASDLAATEEVLARLARCLADSGQS
jgi:DNA-binding MarR family transcriptional regulator